MTTYKVGYFVGSIATASINRLLAQALVRLAPPELQLVEIAFKDLPIYGYDYDADFPPVAKTFKRAIAERRRRPVRHAGVQPLDSGRPEERDRLGESSVGAEFVLAQAVGRDRHVTRGNRHCHCATAASQRAQLLQLSGVRETHPRRTSSSNRVSSPRTVR